LFAVIEIQRLSIDTVQPVASMVGDLLEEIMTVIGSRAFDFDLDSTTLRLSEFLAQKIYDGHFATDGDHPVGFVTAYKSHSLYANGAYGTIPELYVRPQYRCQGIGERLLAAMADTGRERGWQRLEVTTPPIPQFDRTVAFYVKSGFAITGGRKMRIDLRPNAEGVHR
jgi:GNAT superfamily N-acetyltransferase